VTRGWIAILLLGFSACGNTPSGGPDAGADGGGGGLVLDWAVQPGVPGNLEDTVTLDTIELHLRDLRVTGDAAPGDDRTTVPSVDLGWSDGNTPGSTLFAAAPPGLYSHVAFSLEQDLGEGYRLNGTVQVGSTTYPFEIEDERPVAVSLPMSVTLDAGGTATETVRASFHDVVTGVDWTQVSLDDGTLRIEGGAQLDGVRVRMQEAFQALSVP
jgi:hypothetical protein